MNIYLISIWKVGLMTLNCQQNLSLAEDVPIWPPKIIEPKFCSLKYQYLFVDDDEVLVIVGIFCGLEVVTAIDVDAVGVVVGKVIVIVAIGPSGW